MENRINYTWEAQKAFDRRTRQLDAEIENARLNWEQQDMKIPLTRKERWQLALMFLAASIISAAGVYFLIAEALHQIEVGLGKTFGY